MNQNENTPMSNLQKVDVKEIKEATVTTELRDGKAIRNIRVKSITSKVALRKLNAFDLIVIILKLSKMKRIPIKDKLVDLAHDVIEEYFNEPDTGHAEKPDT